MEIIKYGLCAVFVVIAAISDYRTYKIRNKPVLFFLIAGLLLNIVSNGLKGGTDAILGCLFPLVLFPLFALRMLGAGDIKAFCALGSLLGLKQSENMVIFSFLTGAVIAVGFMIFRKNALGRFMNFGRYLKTCFYMRRLLPYDEFSDPGGKFRFAYGILGGFILTVINNFYPFPHL